MYGHKAFNISGPNVDNKIFVITFNMLGKLGMAGCYGSLDLYAPELFPTTLRYMNVLVIKVSNEIMFSNEGIKRKVLLQCLEDLGL